MQGRQPRDRVGQFNWGTVHDPSSTGIVWDSSQLLYLYVLTKRPTIGVTNWDGRGKGGPLLRNRKGL